MPPDLDTWKRLYNVFDPTRRLEESDQHLYVSRPGAVAADIAADLRLSLTRKEHAKGRVWFQPHQILYGLRPGL